MAKGLLSVPNGAAEERPAEVPYFMQHARKWNKPLALQTATEGPFADRWWSWWQKVQPAARIDKEGKSALPSAVDAALWEDVSKMVGRNGVLLYVAGLLWWGEAAVGEENAKALLEDWKVAMLDVALVLGRAKEAVHVCKR
ncbi:hypothetical protein B0H13DRAFT_1648264 [Mycena leptocephala]|nr:hypothetical protein B0H13DRAFT_1648264 [Mycena leptocephala]